MNVYTPWENRRAAPYGLPSGSLLLPRVVSRWFFFVGR